MELRNREQISSNCRETHLVPGRGGESGGFASANNTVTGQLVSHDAPDSAGYQNQLLIVNCNRK
jgi:hypothetical protein